MDTVEWNPGEIITGIHTTSQDNNDELSRTDCDYPHKDGDSQQDAKIHAEEEMARHFELIRRRQSQYTPVPSPVITRAHAVENTNNKEKRSLFCTSVEDGVEM